MSTLSNSIKSPKRPVSVLRKVGSSKCLQQDFKPNINDRSTRNNDTDKTVTLLNVEDLPSFSTERFYMLSQIEMKAHSIHFLSDLYGLGVDDDDDVTQDLSTSSHSLTMDEDMHCMQSSCNHNNGTFGNENTNSTQIHSSNMQQSCHLHLPPCIILYLLWRSDSAYSNPSAYAENVVQPSIRKILDVYQCPTGNGISHDDATNIISSDLGHMNQYMDGRSCKNSLPKIYIVVDRIVVSDHMEQIQEGRETDYNLRVQQSQEKTQIQIDIAETLIRKVSTDSSLNLRQIIHGISVGLSDNIRAAPGLELCMDAILVGDAERRRFSNKWKQSRKSNDYYASDSAINSEQRILWTMGKPNRSSIGIFTEYSDDLTGLDPKQDTDAAQHDLLLHARCNGGWEGNGNIMNFAFLSQNVWKQYWNESEKEMNDDDYLLHMYSIIMGRYGGGKSKRRTGRRSKIRKALKDDTSFQCRFLPCENEQQSVERTANIMILILFISVGYSLWTRHSTVVMEHVQIGLGYVHQFRQNYIER